MFTILWKTPDGGEEIYCAPAVSLVTAAKEVSDQLDCRGRAHIAFQRLTAVEGAEKLHLARTVIGDGDAFVMNADGKTVATYRFKPEDRLSIKAG